MGFNSAFEGLIVNCDGFEVLTVVLVQIPVVLNVVPRGSVRKH